ncbi:MAG: lecithin retinol acyltransferase family protein [bacterium]|nr:lecithin retinol acyltransferase family protein [bacterium]
MEKYKCIEPKIGDIVKVEISNNVYHFGLYLGDDKIIQYGLAKDVFNTKKESVKVLISSMDEFLNGKMALVRVYSLFDKIKKNSVKKSIKKAMDRLGEAKYDLVNNNCEHFVNECVFNKHYSEQTNRVRK